MMRRLQRGETVRVSKYVHAQDGRRRLLNRYGEVVGSFERDGLTFLQCRQVLRRNERFERGRRSFLVHNREVVTLSLLP